jgi:hypothetical protein
MDQIDLQQIYSERLSASMGCRPISNRTNRSDDSNDTLRSNKLSNLHSNSKRNVHLMKSKKPISHRHIENEKGIQNEIIDKPTLFIPATYYSHIILEIKGRELRRIWKRKRFVLTGNNFVINNHFFQLYNMKILKVNQHRRDILDIAINCDNNNMITRESENISLICCKIDYSIRLLNTDIKDITTKTIPSYPVITLQQKYHIISRALTNHQKNIIELKCRDIEDIAQTFHCDRRSRSSSRRSSTVNRSTLSDGSGLFRTSSAKRLSFLLTRTESLPKIEVVSRTVQQGKQISLRYPLTWSNIQNYNNSEEKEVGITNEIVLKEWHDLLEKTSILATLQCLRLSIYGYYDRNMTGIMGENIQQINNWIINCAEYCISHLYMITNQQFDFIMGGENYTIGALIPPSNYAVIQIGYSFEEMDNESSLQNVYMRKDIFRPLHEAAVTRNAAILQVNIIIILILLLRAIN